MITNPTVINGGPDTKQQSSLWKSPNSTRPETARHVKSNIKSMIFIFFDIKGLFIKILSWQAKQSIPHTTATFYGDCVKMCKTSPRTLKTKELAATT
jgi:hypothetical protein